MLIDGEWVDAGQHHEIRSPATDEFVARRAACTFGPKLKVKGGLAVTDTVRWDVEARDRGSTVQFRHAGFGDDEEAGRVAYTWGQIVVALKQYAETGRRDPVFT